MGETFFRFGLLTTVFGGFLFLSGFALAESVGLLVLVFGYIFGVMALRSEAAADE